MLLFYMSFGCFRTSSLEPFVSVLNVLEGNK